MWLVSNTFNMFILVAIPVSVPALQHSVLATWFCSWIYAVINSRVIRKLFATMQNNAMLAIPCVSCQIIFVLGGVNF